MRNAGVRFPWAAASSRPLAHFLIFKKGDFTMQAKKTNPEKTKNPEVLTLDSTYRIGNRSFIVASRDFLLLDCFILAPFLGQSNSKFTCTPIL